MSEAVTPERLLARAEAHLKESLVVKEAFLSGHMQSVVDLGLAIATAFQNGHKLLIAGNGGSAADAQHMAAELVVRLTSAFERQALPAIALTTDSSLVTACSNDYGYEFIFSRQIEAFGQEGDVFLGISTSGNSGNVIKALEVAKERGVVTAVLSGKTGGKLKGMADYSVLVPSGVTAHVQECHITAIHVLCDIIECCYCGKE
ncbi:MAG: D-sedoheptulose 7-phosphate isomerase [Planctomycetota bacterium]|nr:D-sedoheptulose 7-phosphate isomerase [Planctomycetota bacterium]